jgi:hypothetical protein
VRHLVLRSWPQCEIFFYAVGHSARSGSTQRATVRHLVLRSGRQYEILFYAVGHSATSCFNVVGHSARSCSTQWATVRHPVLRSWPQCEILFYAVGHSARSGYAVGHSTEAALHLIFIRFHVYSSIYPRARAHVSLCMLPFIHMHVTMYPCAYGRGSVYLYLRIGATGG